MKVMELMDFTPKNDYHLGHLLLRALKMNPESVCQVDAATGRRESKASVLSRSIRLARSLRKFGLQPGDVMLLAGKNHLDLHIPYYAAFFNGLPICGVDTSYKYDEVTNIFKVVLPKIAFCDDDFYEISNRVVRDLNLDTTVVSFGDGENSFIEFMNKYDNNSAEEFRIAEYDLDNIYCWLPSTSGTTGAVKLVAIKQDQVLTKFKESLQITAKLIKNLKGSPGRMALNMSPLYWISGMFHPLTCALLDLCKLQTSGPSNGDHLIEIINKYRPDTLVVNPTFLPSLINSKKHCDLSSIKLFTLAGLKLRPELYNQIRARLPEGSCLINIYGQTEMIGLIMCTEPYGSPEAFIMPLPEYEGKIVDPDKGGELIQPLERGELWIRGPGFSEYYNNPEETKKVVTEDGWYKTGDIFYKDDAGYFYYVERLKLMMKYKGHKVEPGELELVISKHLSVRDVVVTSIPHDEDGEHPVACVVKHSGANISAKEIIDLVAGELSESKRLRGGVIFLNKIPRTPTGKVAVVKLKQIAQKSKREF